MATSTIKARNSDGKFAEITELVIQPNESITLTSADGLPKRYIAFTQANNAGAFACIIGVGYGISSARHKIVNIIESNYVTFAQANEGAYGLTITNGLFSSNVFLHIIAL